MPKFNLSTFKAMQSDSVLKTQMNRVVREQANQGDVHFVAAKNYTPGKAVLPLFLVVDSAHDFLDYFTEMKKEPGARKDKKSKLPAMKTLIWASGTAEVTKDDKGNHKVLIKTATGALSANIISSSVIKPALGNDSKIEGTTPEREQAEREAQESEAAKRPKPVASELAKASLQKAKDAGMVEVDREFITPQAVNALAEASRQMPEFHKFKQNFDAFMSKYKLSNDGQIPTHVWNALFQALMKSDYKFSNKDIEKAPDGRFKLLVDGPTGQKIREKTLVEAMNGLKLFADHAARYLDMVIEKAESGKTWAFWSGTGAEDAAKASGGVSLEGTVGSFFAKYQNEWVNWKKLLGGDVSEFPLWTSLSEMYAQKGAEYMARYKFVGFVGPGATNDNNVFNSIEQPTFLEVLTVKKQVPPPHIDWFVVDCEKDPANNAWWKPTGKAPKKFRDRQSALANIVERYGK